jgi:hypothetical protein
MLYFFYQTSNLLAIFYVIYFLFLFLSLFFQDFWLVSTNNLGNVFFSLLVIYFLLFIFYFLERTIFHVELPIYSYAIIVTFWWNVYHFMWIYLCFTWRICTNPTYITYEWYVSSDGFRKSFSRWSLKNVNFTRSNKIRTWEYTV